VLASLAEKISEFS